MKKWITTLLLVIIICLLSIILYLLVTRYDEKTEVINESQERKQIEETNNNQQNEIELEETENNTDQKEEEAEIEKLSGITKKEAIEIALTDAKVQNDNLIFLTSYITKYKGEFAYHIKFKTADHYTMYDYVINALTGTIELVEKH